MAESDFTIEFDFKGQRYNDAAAGLKAFAARTGMRVDGGSVDSLRGYISASVPYARIQELGGTISPKAAKYLAIPLPAAVDSRGLPLKPAPRSWSNTFVAKSKAGNLLIFQKQGKSITPLYVLKTSVTIPPRLGMADIIKTGMGMFTDRAMSQMLKAMKNAP